MTETVSIPQWRPMALRTALCFVASVLGWWFHNHYHPLSTALFMVAFLFGGWDLAQETWKDLRGWRFDTHFLMLLVVPCTAAIGAWGEGALLLILFSLSATLENFAMGRTRNAIQALLRGAPKTALVVEAKGNREVPVEEVLPGMILRVMPGQSVPLDMRVSLGSSSCDESSLTGESIPVPKSPGDEAFSGTLNLQGIIEGAALRPLAESTLSRIIRMIDQAQHTRAPSQRLADRFGSAYTATVIIACLLLFLWAWRVEGLRPFLAEGGPSAFYRAMTLLVVMSPCALVLSVPSAILSAIAAGARMGILFRGGAAIEKLHQVKLLALDKTGTLTEGKMRVEKVEVLRGEERHFLEFAGALAESSTHPLSRAISAYARGQGAPLLPVENLENVPGGGLRGQIQGKSTVLGQRDFVRSAFPFEPEEHSLGLGATETWVASEGLLGRFLLRDTLRKEAPLLIQKLHEDGLRTLMLTGDRAPAAEAIARESSIGEFRASLRPEDKVAALQDYKREGYVVAMIGDGVNDAPSLAAADVSVAMGARGSDAAIEQADVVLMNDRLENFLAARDLSHRVRAIMRQNIAVSLGTMAVMALATIVSRDVPLFLGVAMHEGSTAVVVLNSLRLLATKKLRLES